MAPDPIGAPNIAVTTGDEYYVHEVNEVNDYQSGAELLGESFNKTPSQTFSFTIADITTDPVYYRSSEAAHSVGAYTYFTYSNNGTSIGSRACNDIIEAFDAAYYSTIAPTENYFTTPSPNFNVLYTFDKKNNPEARGWLDYFEVVARMSLKPNGGQMAFRDSRSLSASNTRQFNFITPHLTPVWAVSN